MNLWKYKNKPEPCKNCGYVDVQCFFDDCIDIAEWQGWYRVTMWPDNKPSGRIIRTDVCDNHKLLLIGYNKN